MCATISLDWEVGILVDKYFSAKMAISAFHKQLDKVPVFFLICVNNKQFRLQARYRSKDKNRTTFVNLV